MYRIGIDFGGTKLESIILDASGVEVFRKRIPTEAAVGYDHILNNIASLYRETTAHIDNAPHTCGVGIPGACSTHTGRVKNSNTTCTIGRPLKDDLECLLKRSVGIENDANCFAIAEASYGAGRGHPVVFGAILGTGCGGGIVINKVLWSGHMAIAGEWGHMSIDPMGADCYCGQKGCVETYVSGGGMQKRYALEHGESLAFHQIAEQYFTKEPHAVAFIQEFLQAFGRSLANLIAVLDPDIIVLGGGVSNFEPLYSEGIQEVRRHVFSDVLDTPIVRNTLGDSAGVIGAALIGL